jgi:apolipoprotein N-acyltransferase
LHIIIDAVERFFASLRMTMLLLRRFILPVATGALLALTLPPFNAGQLGWVALVPLLFAVDDCRPGEAFRRGYIAGLVFFGATVWWTIHVTLPGMIALVAFLALYIGAAAVWFCLSLNWNSGTDSVLRNLTTMILATAGWVTLEWIRGWFLFGGFGWNLLGVTQHEAMVLVQFASFTGVYGVSALVCFANLAFYFTIRRFIRQIGRVEPLRRLSYEFYIAMLLVCVAFLHGLNQMQTRPAARSLRVALVQGDIPQSLKLDSEKDKPLIVDRYRTLTEQAAAARPELIIWPETATPMPLRYDPESFALVTNLTVHANTPLLTGTIDQTPYRVPVEAFNAAVLVFPDATLGAIYRKIHLVPFGEFVPLHKITPVFKYLTPIGDSFERGREHTVFTLTNNVRFGVVICFEDTVPDLYRRFVKRGVDFMVNLTNDAWFKDSPAAAMQLANAVFRCVETRRPLVRATNNGITCIVDERGIVRREKQLEPFTHGILVTGVELTATSEQTFYTLHGDWFAGVCAAVIVIAAGWRFVAWRERRVPVKSAA